jgi:predicted acetylornithine/succinylornithine family transaminase
MKQSDKLIEKAKRVQLGNYKPAPVVLTEGHGVRVKDVDGREYFDLAAGIAVTSVGHSHPKLGRAIAEQAMRLMHVSNLFYNDKAIALAEKLIERTAFDRVFFCNSGTEANEALIKLARRHQFSTGRPERVEIIATLASFHGRSMGALTLTGQKKYHEGVGPMLGGVQHVPYADLNAMRAAVSDKTAAIIVEPIQAEGGLFVPPPGYLAGLRELCDQHGLLLLFDEVQTGYGRTGPFLGAEADGVVADACSLAKGIAGGFPFGAMLVRDAFAGALVPGTHASTFGGNALACAAGLAVLEIFDEERVLENVKARGAELEASLAQIVAATPAVIEQRGRGLLRGLLLAPNVDPATALATLREQGVLVTLAGGNVLRISPALTITGEELAEGMALVGRALSLLAKDKSDDAALSVAR